MINLKRKLLALAMISVISGGTFAQKRGEDKRPPKDKDNRVVVKPKNERPPQQKDRDDKKRDGRRGKP